MTLNEHFANALQNNWTMLNSTVADMSDAELLMRPVVGANHPNWQLGHALSVESRLLGFAGAKVPPLPADFMTKYSKQTATSDDASAFLKKEELLSLIEQTRAATIAWVKTATQEQLDAPAPEAARRMAPTMMDVVGLQIGHYAMHLGQIQVLRRKLGKPVLF